MADFSQNLTNLITAIQNFGAGKLEATAGVAKGLKYATYAVPTTSGVVSIDLSIAQLYLVTPAADITVNFTNLPQAGEYITSMIRMTNGGLYSVTWPANSVFEDGVPPVLSTNSDDLLSIQYDAASDKFWITNVKSNWASA